MAKFLKLQSRESEYYLRVVQHRSDVFVRVWIVPAQMREFLIYPFTISGAPPGEI